MSDPAMVSEVQPIAERLALETNRPVEQVAEIYASESAEPERGARIKTFIDVLAIQRTKVILSAL
jgi:hypothetical protein